MNNNQNKQKNLKTNNLYTKSQNKENFGTIYWMTFYMYCCLTLLATILGLVLHRKFKIALLILYIYLIKRTLDNGEASVPTEYSSASYGNNSYGVVRDDFDAFMNTDSYYGNTINSSNNSTDSSSSFNLRGYEPTNRDDQ